MCMFFNKPERLRIPLAKPIYVWRCFKKVNTQIDGHILWFPHRSYRGSREVPRRRWLKTGKVGFHAFRTRAGALKYRRGWESGWVVKRVKVRGRVFAEGFDGGHPGLRVSQMFVP